MTLLSSVFLSLLALHLAAAVVMNRLGIRKTGDSVREERCVVFPAFPYIVLLISRLREQKPLPLLMAGLQTALFAMACMLGNRHGFYSRELVSPLNIGAGLIAAHVIFGVSLSVTHRQMGDVAEHLLDLGSLWNFTVEHPRVLMQFVTVSVAEEVIYRAGAQPLLIGLTGSALIGILASAVVFSLVHDHFLKNSLGQSSEFLGFSLLLGALFYWTGSLILIIVIHTVRNIEIAYIEHLGRIADAGDEELADCEAEYLSGESSLVMVVASGDALNVECFQYRPEPPRALRMEPAVKQA